MCSETEIEIIEGETISLVFDVVDVVGLDPSTFAAIKFQVRKSSDKPFIIDKSLTSGITATTTAFSVALIPSDTLNKVGLYKAQAYMETSPERVVFHEFDFKIKGAIAR
jgi:hypothetical protein